MTSLRVRSPASALLRCGISMPIVEHRRWMGQWLGSPAERYSSEVVRFVFEERQIEAALAPLDVPGTCGPLMASDGHGLPGTCGLVTSTRGSSQARAGCPHAGSTSLWFEIARLARCRCDLP